jgi:hypothetical protein
VPIMVELAGLTLEIVPIPRELCESNSWVWENSRKIAHQ